MERFEKTILWQKTLSTQNGSDTEAENRDRLRFAYMGFRNRAAMLASEIKIDLPNFTVHDITHIDALWEMAQLITGPDFPLTPAEAFVLGGAFLIHDLGMGLAAYPEGIDELYSTPLWDDSIVALLKEQLGRHPTIDEVKEPSAIIKEQAMCIVLRELHAKHAERLAPISWKDSRKNKTEYFLIDDPELRNTYGPIIGTIAHSHWWPVDQLIQKMPMEMGAPGGFDNNWTVDPVKLACILRTADASHLDDRRAPSFLGALRKPNGLSADHWLFQEKLYQPRLESDRLTYTSKSEFSLDEASAWWRCYDTLQLVDRELRHVDALLADTNRHRLRVRGVSYIEDPMRMAKIIRTANWIPVDTRIKVGDVAKLIGNLGGESLYGQNIYVPLRELIQNASDAVIARRLLEGRSQDWGCVTVRCGKDESGQWIEVEDTGIGMSSAVLTGPFLDFGTSFWGTPLMHKELPGLEAKGFSSTGQFGIGFFSVFMWGEQVQVFTRRAEFAREETLVLEFHNGLTARPLLRKAVSNEQLIEGGTRIRIWLKESNIFEKILYGPNMRTAWTFEERCAWLCPTLDVNLYVEQKEKNLVICASDWISMEASEFVWRLIGYIDKKKRTKIEVFVNEVAPKMGLIKSSSGEIVGRACVFSKETKKGYHSGLDEFTNAGVITIGGFRSSGLNGIIGALVGEPHTTSRDVGVPIATFEDLQPWTSEQANLNFDYFIKDSEAQSETAAIIYALGGSTQKLHIAEHANGWKSTEDISREQYDDEIIIVQDAALRVSGKYNKIVLHKNVFSVEMGRSRILQTGRFDLWFDWPSIGDRERDWDDNWIFHSKTLEGALIEAIAKSWGVPLRQVLEVSLRSTDEQSIEREIGTCDGEPFILNHVTVIRKPK